LSFANKFGGRKIATPGSPVATSNSLMGNLVPQAFQGQDADYQAYLESVTGWPANQWIWANGVRKNPMGVGSEWDSANPMQWRRRAGIPRVGYLWKYLDELQHLKMLQLSKHILHRHLS